MPELLPMSLDDVVRIRQLFDRVSELPEAEVARYLDVACRDEARIRLEVGI